MLKGPGIGQVLSFRHGRACPGHLDERGIAFLSEMLATSAGMTSVTFTSVAKENGRPFGQPFLFAS
jgi:hypothetical protein